jgi:hypothetical protein
MNLSMKNILILFFMVFPFLRLMSGSPEHWSYPPDTLSSLNQNASDPQIVIDPNGNVVAAWVENGVIKTSTKIGGVWSGSSTLSGSDASSPKLVVDPNGKATAIWLEGDVLNAATMPFNSSWGSYTVLSSSGVSFPQLSIDQSGNIVAIWVNNGVIQSATKLLNGSWPSMPDTISDSGSDSPQAAIGGSGTIVAVWHGMADGIDAIYSASRDLAGNWSAGQTISRADINSVYPQIALDADGNALAAWFIYNLAGSVYSNVIVQTAAQSAGGSWSSPVNVSTPGIRNPADLTARLAFDAEGNAIAVWTMSFDGSYFLVQTAKKPVNGVWTLPSSLIRNFYAFATDLSLSSVGDAYIVFMNRDPSTNSLFIEAVETDLGSHLGFNWTVPMTLSEGPTDGYPRIAVSAGSQTNVAVIWINFNGTNCIIQSVTGTEDFFPPPSNLSVEQNVQNYGIYDEYYNVLSWQASSYDEVDGYLVFRNGTLIAQTESSILTFSDRNRKQNESVTYGIAAFNSSGAQSPVIYINFPYESNVFKFLTPWW